MHVSIERLFWWFDDIFSGIMDVLLEVLFVLLERVLVSYHFDFN